MFSLDVLALPFVLVQSSTEHRTTIKLDLTSHFHSTNILYNSTTRFEDDKIPYCFADWHMQPNIYRHAVTQGQRHK